MAGAHAKRSPSGSPAWTLCLAKLNREAGILDLSDKTAANRGTICHDISARVLQGDEWAIDAAAGKNAAVDEATGDVTYRMPDAPGGYPVDQDIIDSARAYTRLVKDLAIGGQLEVEQRLSIEHITGEIGAKGTSDAVILFPDRRYSPAFVSADQTRGAEICVTDLKSGREVVYAKVVIDQALSDVTGRPVGSLMPNTQLVMYASGAVRVHSMWHDITHVRLMIVQPPLDHVDEIVLTIAEFNWWVDWIKARAELSKDPNAPATPGEKQCKYCRFASQCPELRDFAINTALANFDEPGQVPATRAVTSSELPKIYGALDLIESWCSSMRHRMFMELNSGTLDERCGWKLVKGRKGNRYWTDRDEVRRKMEAAKLNRDEMYTAPELISPTTADGNLAKAKPDLWAELSKYIGQPDGKLTVAPTSDERPAVSPANNAIACFDTPAESGTAGPTVDLSGYFN